MNNYKGERILNRLLEMIKERIIKEYGDRLTSIVIFGSVARGRYKMGSDIDLLLVAEDLEDSLGKRIDTFFDVVKNYWKTEEYGELRKAGFPCKIQPIILEPEEIKKRPPLLLDITVDQKVLFDKDGFFEREMKDLSKELERLGSKRVLLGEDRWYWIIKPGIKRGEVVEI